MYAVYTPGPPRRAPLRLCSGQACPRAARDASKTRSEHDRRSGSDSGGLRTIRLLAAASSLEYAHRRHRCHERRRKMDQDLNIFFEINFCKKFHGVLNLPFPSTVGRVRRYSNRKRAFNRPLPIANGRFSRDPSNRKRRLWERQSRPSNRKRRLWERQSRPSTVTRRTPRKGGLREYANPPYDPTYGDRPSPVRRTSTQCRRSAILCRPIRLVRRIAAGNG
jgi:hypothetical protein